MNLKGGFGKLFDIRETGFDDSDVDPRRLREMLVSKNMSVREIAENFPSLSVEDIEDSLASVSHTCSL